MVKVHVSVVEAGCVDYDSVIRAINAVHSFRGSPGGDALDAQAEIILVEAAQRVGCQVHVSAHDGQARAAFFDPKVVSPASVVAMLGE